MDCKIYNNNNELFIDVIEYNNSNPYYMPEYNIPVSNKYYVLLLDNNNNDVKNIIDYITGEDRDIKPLGDIDLLTFDYEQMLFIDLQNNSLKNIDKHVNELENNVNESCAELVFILDIEYLLNFVKLDDTIHIYDFILYKFTKKFDKIYILDKNNILRKNNKDTLLLEQLYTLLKNYNTKINSGNEYNIYKYIDSFYWRILDNDNVVYDNENENNNNLEEKILFASIDNEDVLITKQDYKTLLDANIFDIENNNQVLHPLHKLEITQ